MQVPPQGGFCFRVYYVAKSQTKSFYLAHKDIQKLLSSIQAVQFFCVHPKIIIPDNSFAILHRLCISSARN
jgi:hypothetical protein